MYVPVTICIMLVYKLLVHGNKPVSISFSYILIKGPSAKFDTKCLIMG